MIPISKFNRSEKIWYLNQILGRNSSKTNEVVTPSSASPLKVANHNARKTGLSNLLRSDINPLMVQQLSGHKNLESLISYYTVSDKQP